MLVRYISISILKWLFSFFAVSVISKFIIPATFTGWWLDISMWTMTSIIALVFAEWAFKPRTPTKKDVVTLLVVWTIVTCLMSMGFDIMLWGKPIFLIKAWDIKVQYVLELIMVGVAAYLARHRRRANALSEGMEA